MLVEPAEHCSDPRLLNFTSWPTMPGITVDQVDKDGMIQRSAGDALQGSPNEWLVVRANDAPFSVRIKLNEPCPVWEIVSFGLQVEGVDSFYAKLGDRTSKNVQVQCTVVVSSLINQPSSQSVIQPANRSISIEG